MTLNLERTDLAGFSQEAAEAISERIGEPGWAQAHRMEAWRVYNDTPLPARTDEQWRRTDLSALRLDAFRSYLGGPTVLPKPALSLLEAAPERAGLVAQAQSENVAIETSDELRRKGVVFTSLERAMQEHPELVEPYLLAQGILPSFNKFAALNGAFWSGGVFLYVPRGVVVEQPFLSMRWLDAPVATGILPRTLIVLEPGSSILYVDQSASETHEGSALHCGITEVFLKEAAALHYIGVQEWGGDLWDFSMMRAVQQQHSRFRALTVSLGGLVSRVHLEAALEGQGAEAQLRGVYIGDGRQHFEFRTLQDHRAPHTTSDLLFKGALRDRANAAYEGTVRMQPGAARSSANQANRNLLLNKGAKADSVPVLEILANDVERCSHGATVGQVDEDQLLYLTSRGLSQAEAHELIVAGFVEPILDQIPLEQLQTRLKATVGKKLARLHQETDDT